MFTGGKILCSQKKRKRIDSGLGPVRTSVSISMTASQLSTKLN